MTAGALANAIARLTGEQPTTELAQIVARARQAAQVATELETHDPGKNQDRVARATPARCATPRI